MREIKLSKVSKTISLLCIEANLNIRGDVLNAVKNALENETSELGKEVLEQVIENADIAFKQRLPICQDTGYVSVFVEFGIGVNLIDDLDITGMGSSSNPYDADKGRTGSKNTPNLSILQLAIDNGVRQAYKQGSFRKSMVEQPVLERINTGDNSPTSVYIDFVNGENIKLTVMIKGGGTENASVLKMLPVAGDVEAVKQFVIETAENAAKSCPPVIVGVGIGGSFDKVGHMAKKALLRQLNDRNPDKNMAVLEEELLDLINKTGIGPAGLGGNTTALAVKIETAATHIACLPVAIAFNCIAARQAEALL
jgi:fumarate hydratase subunit alpha